MRNQDQELGPRETFLSRLHYAVLRLDDSIPRSDLLQIVLYQRRSDLGSESYEKFGTKGTVLQTALQILCEHLRFHFAVQLKSSPCMKFEQFDEDTAAGRKRCKNPAEDPDEGWIRAEVGC